MHYEAQQSTARTNSQKSSLSVQRTPAASFATLAHLPQSLLGADVYISQDDLFLNYTRVNLLHNIESEIAALGTGCRLSDASSLALATIFFGTEHRNSAVIQRGLQRYNSAIEEINTALRDSGYLHSPDLFNAILTMSFLEVDISATIPHKPALVDTITVPYFRTRSWMAQPCKWTRASVGTPRTRELYVVLRLDSS